jgi:hypothetical protein
MKIEQAGIHIDSTTRVLVGGGTQVKRIGDLKPGDKVGQVGSTWYFTVDEIRIRKRHQRAFEIKLESGEKVLLAAGTILCGQYGPNIVAEVKDKILFLANLGRFHDSTHSRRQFEVQFQAPEQYLPLIKRLCQRNDDEIETFRKKFYRWTEMFNFLSKIIQKRPEIEVVTGLFVDRHSESDLYDFVDACPNHKGYLGLFMPLFELNEIQGTTGKRTYTPAVIAFEGSYRIASRKVVSCKPVVSEGPWAFPIFDSYESSWVDSHQRFSFSVGGIPVFYPNPFISDFGVRATLPVKKQPLLPPPRKRVDVCTVDFSGVFKKLKENASLREATPAERERLITAVLDALDGVIEAGVTEDCLLTEMDRRINLRCVGKNEKTGPSDSNPATRAAVNGSA